MSEKDSSNKIPIILPFQRALFERMCAIARGCLNVDRSAFKSVRVRNAFLLLGRTGCGKTYLATALARELQVPLLSLSTSDWILLGGVNRGSTATWPAIFEFLERSMQARGAILYIDELDKCYHDTHWNAFLRSEIFSLCDTRIPLGLNDLDGAPISQSRLLKVAEYLRDKTLILAGAAFQHLWDQKSRSTMGFLPTHPDAGLPELPELAKTLPRELINRFSSEIFVLPELQKGDYQEMVKTMADTIPDIWRSRFLELGLARVDQAVSHQKGVRYVEEILLAAIVEERGNLANYVPPSAHCVQAEIES